MNCAALTFTAQLDGTFSAEKGHALKTPHVAFI